jgi:hypothetical protein
MLIYFILFRLHVLRRHLSDDDVFVYVVGDRRGHSATPVAKPRELIAPSPSR